MIVQKKENEPPKKKPKRTLPDAEFVKIRTGEKLSDLSIDFAQGLLKKKFPGVNGLQSNLYQYKLRPSVPPKDQLQLIHSRGDHWIVASTIGCSSDKVLVYDSVYSTLDNATLDVIANLFRSSTVKMLECQKQEGGKDCGLICHCLCHCNWTWSRPNKSKATTRSYAKSLDQVL